MLSIHKDFTKDINMTFDWQKPTTAMVGSWESWEPEDTETFRDLLKENGQVAVMLKDNGVSNPPMLLIQIINALGGQGFRLGYDFIIMQVPNVTNI